MEKNWFSVCIVLWEPLYDDRCISSDSDGYIEPADVCPTCGFSVFIVLIHIHVIIVM